uniref:Ycf54 n=1 Tax=Polysiphonia sp. TaxID=1967842 RepID=A0A1Z1MTM4_9FLOR|nr:hypothetical protein [Polysiphonia sp.]
MHDYHFAVASQSFFLDQEPVEEILRERTQYYLDSDKEVDFWFVLNPHFINLSDYKINCNNQNIPFAAIVSSNQQFIQWVKLRLVFVCVGSFKSNSVFLPS